MKNFFASKNWLKMITRDIPFTRIVMVYETYAQNSKNDTGIDFPFTLAVYKEGIYEIYRSKDETIKFAKEFLKIKNKKIFFEVLFKKVNLLKEKIERELNQIEKKLKSDKNISEREYLAIFKKLYILIKRFWNTQYFPRMFEFCLGNYGRNDLISKYENYLISIREQAQYLTVKLEDLIDAVLKKIAQKKRLNQELIFYAKPSEILKNKIRMKDLMERKKFVLTGFKGKKVFIFQGEKAINLVEHLIFSGEKTGIAEIKGSSGYSGIVRGKVKVIIYRKDLNKLKNNQILVTPSTEAFYTPYLKKVKAIITEEGGITCHAAIISRELKKPCIIGTKIATKVLKDGDSVEVDANKGIVRIIKQ